MKLSSKGLAPETIKLRQERQEEGRRLHHPTPEEIAEDRYFRENPDLFPQTKPK